MKKVLLGCLGVLVLASIAGGIVVYVKVIKPGMEFAGGMIEIGQEFEKLNDSVDNQSNFSAPSDGALDEGTFQRFLAAQNQMRTRMEGRLQELEAKYQQIEAEIDERGGQAGIGEVVGAYADMADLLIEAKRAQVDALNAQNFSLEEYRWARDRTYKALGESVAIAAFNQNGNSAAFNQTVPQETIDMVEPHREELMQAHVFAVFGL